MKKTNLEIRESQIEDVLVSANSLTKRVLQLSEEPRLISRQMPLPSGRLDLLYAYQAVFILIELKVTRFNVHSLNQVLSYKADLIGFQNQGKLIQGEIIPYVLCTDFNKRQKLSAKEVGVELLTYSPLEIIKAYNNDFKPIALFAERKPVDFGIWNFHLIHELIYALNSVKSFDELKESYFGSSKTMANKLRFAQELGLVTWATDRDLISLTELGKQYANSKDAILPDRISDLQADLLRKALVTDPYASSVTLGIAAIVEATFILLQNNFPVPFTQLVDYFAILSGKHFDWKTKKAKYNAASMYCNYAVNLGLLGKSQNSVFLTPAGYKFVIQMQMHKSLKLLTLV